MLPRNIETARGRRLQDIVQASSEENLFSWPDLNDDDYARIGKLIVTFSYIDFNIRRIVDDHDDAGLLCEPWKGRSKKLRMFEAEEALKSILHENETHRVALFRITELRGLRNLVAHFAIKRFPDDDAFLFLGKSASDYRQIFGGEPDPALMLTAVLESSTITNALKELRGLQNWIATASSQIATQLHAAKLIKR